MAKINKTSRPNLWLIRIHVDDPMCTWNINSKSSFYKLIKANNASAAVKGAGIYCSKQMQNFPEAHFKYSSHDVKPYFNSFFERVFEKEQV